MGEDDWEAGRAQSPLGQEAQQLADEAWQRARAHELSEDDRQKTVDRLRELAELEPDFKEYLGIEAEVDLMDQVFDLVWREERESSDQEFERPPELIDDLGHEGIDGRYTGFARLVLEARGLWQKIPEDERTDCQMRVAQEVSNVFRRNGDWATGEAGRSYVVGLQAEAAAERARLEIEHRYGTPRREGVPWELAAAANEYRLAQEAVDFARRRTAPDVRAAALECRDRAAHQLDAARRWHAGVHLEMPQRTVSRKALDLGPPERDPRLAAHHPESRSRS